MRPPPPPAPQIINIPPDTQSDTLDATITFPSNGLFYVVVEAINDTDPTKTALSDVLKITVVDAVSSSSKLLTFQINGSSATISGSNVDITLPAGTVLTALVASFTASSGASVSVNDVAQVSGATPNDFSQPLVYTVTAADSSNSEQYTVTVSLSESLASPPGAVTDLSTTSPATDTIPLTWSPLTLGPDDKKADGSPLTDSDVLIEVFYSVMNDENITATEIIAQNTTSESSYDNSASTATITNLLPNTPYAIVLKLTNNSDTATPKISSHSNVLRTSTQSAATLPVAMSDLTVGADAHAPTTNAITVTWSPLTLGPDDKKADGTALTDADIIIEVYYSSDPAHDSAEKIADNGSKLTSSLDNTASRVLLPDLSPYTAYAIVVKLINRSDISMFSYSNIVQASTLSAASIPAQVSDLQVATGPDAPGINTITVTWSPLTLGPDDKKADGTALADADITIEAYYSSDPAHDSAEKIIANGSQFTSSFDNTSAKAAISGLIPNTAYAIALKLINRSDDTKFSLSNMVQASTVASAATAPGAPTGLTLDATTKQQISASWTAPQDTGLANDGVSPATISYTIYYSTTMPADAAALQESATLAQTYIAGLTSTSTIIASMGDTRYYIAVAAVNTSDTSKTAVSGVESVLTPSEETAPGAPTGLTLNTATKDQIAVSWFAPQTLGTKNDGSTLTEAEIAYKLYYTPTDPSNDPQQVKSSAGTTNVISVEAGTPLTATITELTGKAWYYVVVESIHPQHDSLTTLSEVGSAETLSEATAPGAPTGVSLNIATKDQITVSWTAPQDVGLADDGISPATITYIIYYSTSADAATDAAALKAQATTDGTHKTSQSSPTTISPVREKTVYYVVVEAANSSNTSLASLSSVVHDTTASESSAPGAPTGITLNPATKDQIAVSWVAPQTLGAKSDGSPLTEAEIAYKLYYTPTDPSGDPQKVKSNAGATNVVSVDAGTTTLTATITGITGKTWYYVVVESIHPEHASLTTLSEIASAETLSEATAPAAPTGVSLNVATKNQITVSWTAPQDTGLADDGTSPATIAYTIYYSTSAATDAAALKAKATIDGTHISSTGSPETIDAVLGATMYYVVVEAANSLNANLAALSDIVQDTTASEATAPDAPTAVTLDVSMKDQITVSWTAPENTGLTDDGTPATITYIIYYSTTAPADAAALKTQATADTTHLSSQSSPVVISPVQEKTVYYVAVEAVNTSDNSLTALSSVVHDTAASEASAPGAPTGITLDASTKDQIIASWFAPQTFGTNIEGDLLTSAEIAYKVYYTTTDPGTDPQQVKSSAGTANAVSVAAETLTATITGITGKTWYYVVVEAVHPQQDSLSTLSAIESAETLSEATTPGAPTDVSLNVATKDQITVSWTAPQDIGLADDGTSPATIAYTIYYSTSAAADADAAALKAKATIDGTHISSTGSPETIDAVLGATMYYVVVEAANSLNANLAALSDIVQDTTASEATAPDAPTAVTLDVSEKDQITVSWTAPENTGLTDDGTGSADITYIIYYSTSTFTDAAALKAQAITDATHLSSQSSPGVISPVQEKTAYYVAVEAVNTSDNSLATLSSVAHDTAASEASAPAAPTGITLDTAIKDQIIASWVAPQSFGTNIDGDSLTSADIAYKVYYTATDPGADPQQVKSSAGTANVVSVAAETLTATITGITGKTWYYVVVEAVHPQQDSLSTLSEVASAETLSEATAPDAPTAVTLDVATKDQIAVSWTAPLDTGLADDGTSPADITYTIYYSTTAATDAATLKQKAITENTYLSSTGSPETISSVLGATTYYVAVEAANALNTSLAALSDIVQDTTASELTAPGAATSVALDRTVEDQLGVSWSPPNPSGTYDTGNSLDPAEIAYKVYYSTTNPNGNSQLLKSSAGENMISIAAGTRATTISGLIGLTLYYVVVEAIHPQQTTLTSLSAVASIETSSEATLPDAPTDVALDAATVNQITVSWTAPLNTGLAGSGEEPATIEYKIHYSTTMPADANALKGDPNGTHISVTASPETISSVLGSTTYYVAVEAVNTTDKTKTALSHVVHATTVSEATAPGAPTGVSLNVDIKNEITVSWTAPQNTGLASDGKTVGELIYKVYYHPGSYTDPATLKQEAEDDSYVVSVPYSPAVISSVLGATKYSIIVEAIISSDQSKRAVTPGIQSATTASEVSAPGAPTALTLDASTKEKITVHWTAPVDKGLQPNGEDPAVVTYTLYYLASSTKVVATIVADGTAIGDITQLSHTIDNVLGDTVYAVAVESVNSHARTLTALSEAATARTVSQAEAPGAPDNVTLDAATKDEITVSWDEPQEKGLQPNGVDAAAITYKIYYSTTKTTASEIKTEANSAGVSINGNTAVISSVLGLTQYYVIVEAVNAQESALTALSAVASAETASEAAAPGTFLLETPTETSGQIALSWDTPQDPLHSDGSVATITYHVYYSTTATTAGEIKAEANSDGVSISGTTATINPTGGIDADLNYYIVVEAVNGGNDLLTTFSNVKILSAFAYNNLALFVEDAAQARIPKWRGSETGTATYRFTDPESVPWLSINPTSGEVSIAGDFPVGAVNAEVEAIKGGATYTTIITVLIQYNMDQFLLSYEDEARFITYPNDETRKQLTWSLSQDITMLPASAHSTRIQELYNAALLTITDNVDFSIQRVDGDADMFGMSIDTALGELSIEPTKPATDGIEYRIRATGRGDNFPGTKEGAFMLFVDIALCRPNKVEEETGKYPITTAFQLYRVSDDLSASYTLKNSIDLGADALTCITQEGTTTYSMQTLPLGSSTQSFSGEFEGNGHSISQLEMIRDQNNDDYVGLFGYVNGASIKNLVISHDGIRGRDYVGVLAGHVEDATIEGITIRYSSATAKIHGRNDVGGLIGKVSGDSTVTNAEAIGPNAISPKDTNYYDIHGTYHVGGLIGHVEEGTESFLVKITGHALGTVHGFDKVGGLIGNINGRIQVTGYASGFVKGNAYIGGLVGRMIGTAEVIGYARGSAEGSSSMVGGLVGDMEGGKVRGYVTGELDGDDPDYEIGRAKGKSAGGLAGSISVSATHSISIYGYSRHIVETYAENSMGFLTSTANANIKGYYSKSEVSKEGGTSIENQKISGIHGIPVFVRETTHQEKFDLLTFGSELGEWTWVGAGKWPALNMGELKPTDEQPTTRYTAAYDTCSGVDIQGQSTDTEAAIKPPFTNFRYRISRWEHLQWMDNCLDGDFTLENDITLPNPNDPAYSTHRPDLTPGDDPLKDHLSTFDPIGEGNVPFTGSLEGNGFHIRNFVMTDETVVMTDEPDETGGNQLSYLGLFEQLEDATIENLHIVLNQFEKPFIGIWVQKYSIEHGMGILAGTANNSTLNNIRILRDNGKGRVEVGGANLYNVGGIVGHLKGKSTLTGFISGFEFTSIGSTIHNLGSLVGHVSQEDAPDGYPKVYGYAKIDTFLDADTLGVLRIGGLVGYTKGKVTVAGYVHLNGEAFLSGFENLGGLVGKTDGGAKIRGYVAGGHSKDNLFAGTTETAGNNYHRNYDTSGALIGEPKDSDELDFQGYYNGGRVVLQDPFLIPENLKAACTPLFSIPADSSTIYAYRTPESEPDNDPDCALVPYSDTFYRGVRLTYPIVKNQFTGFTFGSQLGEWTWVEGKWPAINIGTGYPGAHPNEQPISNVEY